MRLKILAVLILVLLLGAGLVSVGAKTVASDVAKTFSTNLEALQSLPEAINSMKSPDIKNPDWLQAELDAETVSKLAAEQQAARVVYGSNGVVTYDVATRGTITANLSEFKAQAAQTYSDSRGWSRLGISFQEVASGGNFTLWLSEAGQLPSFYPSVCSIDWSCSVGRNVIINQDRWLGASATWTGPLRDYRHMVINHETGHWLGHLDDNAHCGGSGQLAPLMQQQSINLLGCSFNPWPLDSELWSSRLGI